MKKILGLAAGIMLTVASYAQSGISFTDAKDGYNKATTQTFHFYFNSSYTLEDINKAAEFYVDYFTVEAEAKDGGHVVSIKLVEDNDMSRRVVGRFFTTLSVEQISVNGTDIPVMDFVSNYIML